MDQFHLKADLPKWTVGFDFEDEARRDGFSIVAGVDEVGRGCLAGPVVAAACILDRSLPIPVGLDDSKKVSPKQRERLADELRASAVSYSIGQVEADEIDETNILIATKRAMLLAVAALAVKPDFLLIDALRLAECQIPQKAIIRGDGISASIAAASIIAKTYRDRLMTDYAAEFPVYKFSSHKGYGSAAHLDALRRHGPCPIHRKTFRGVL